MDEKEMYAVLLKRIPALEKEPNIKDATCAYKIAAFFAVFTKKLIREGNVPAVKACLDTAEYLLKKGHYEVRTAIENVFLFSVSQDVGFHKVFANQLPPLLKEEYHRQVNCSGI